MWNKNIDIYILPSNVIPMLTTHSYTGYILVYVGKRYQEYNGEERVYDSPTKQ